MAFQNFKWRKLCALPLSSLFVLSLNATAQQATVSFTLDFPGSSPSHYQVAVGDDGHGSYSSNGQLDEHSDAADPTALEFSVPPDLRKQIFDLAAHAHYFGGKLDSSRKNIASTGAKTLAYKDPHRSSQASYNYSEMAPVEQLTAIFQGLSATLEFGRRLEYYHKYEKLALDDELKRMEELQKQNSLVGVQAVAAILKNIAQDSSVMNVSRARALRLLGPAGK